MDRLQAMAAFVAVADAGGFAAGARHLGLSPPTATRAVAELEARLGAKLLHRTTRSVRTTEAGARYLADCRRLLAEVAEAERQAAGVHGAPRGRVAVGASVLFGRMVVAPALRRLLDRYPGLAIDALFLDRVVNVVEEGVDVAVRIADLPDSGLQAIRVGAVRRVVCAAPAYLAAHGAPAAPEDLADHATVDFLNLDRPGEWAFRRDGRTVVARHRPRLTVNTADVAIAAAKAGEGLTRVLSYMVAEDVAAGRLVQVLEDFALPPVPVHVLHKEPGLTSARVRAVVDGLVSDLRRSPLLL
ncbi:MAG: LysR family transcriptional regulator [Alphaproteobacteria bacterium]